MLASTASDLTACSGTESAGSASTSTASDVGICSETESVDSVLASTASDLTACSGTESAGSASTSTASDASAALGEGFAESSTLILFGLKLEESDVLT